MEKGTLHNNLDAQSRLDAKVLYFADRRPPAPSGHPPPRRMLIGEFCIRKRAMVRTTAEVRPSKLLEKV